MVARERGVLQLRRLRVPRSLAKSCRRFEIRVDTAFGEVLPACADPRRPGGWIDGAIAAAYAELHRLGWAHSVEAWQDGELVGGLYGVAIGGLFAGESMFHRVRDASKVALVGLVELLGDEYADARLLDVQWRTEHLASLGAIEVPRVEYVHALPLPFRSPFPPPGAESSAPPPSRPSFEVEPPFVRARARTCATPRMLSDRESMRAVAQLGAAPRASRARTVVRRMPARGAAQPRTEGGSTSNGGRLNLEWRAGTRMEGGSTRWVGGGGS